MHKDQRNLLASVALAGTVIAGIAGTAAVVQTDGNAFMKYSSAVVASGPFVKLQPSAAPVDPYIKIDFS